MPGCEKARCPKPCHCSWRDFPMRSVSTSSGASPARRSASLAGLWLALEGAARLRGRAADVASLRFPAGGRPQLAGGPFFSVSHGLTHVAAAVCESLEIGFDLEEADAGPGSSHGVREKLQRWTATEAALKAAGRGLREARRSNWTLLATASWPARAIGCIAGRDRDRRRRAPGDALGGRFRAGRRTRPARRRPRATAPRGPA